MAAFGTGKFGTGTFGVGGAASIRVARVAASTTTLKASFTSPTVLGANLTKAATPATSLTSPTAIRASFSAAQIRIARVTAITSLLYAQLVSPTSLGVTITTGAGGGARLRIAKIAGQPGSTPVQIRIAELSGSTRSTSSGINAQLSSPTALSANLRGTFSLSPTFASPTTIRALISGAAYRVASVRAWSTQSFGVWNGSAWIADPSALLASPTALSGGVIRSRGLNSSLASPTILSAIVTNNSAALLSALLSPTALLATLTSSTQASLTVVLASPTALSGAINSNVKINAALSSPTVLFSSLGGTIAYLVSSIMASPTYLNGIIRFPSSYDSPLVPDWYLRVRQADPLNGGESFYYDFTKPVS